MKAHIQIKDRKSKFWFNYERKYRGRALQGDEIVEVGFFSAIHDTELMRYATQNEFGSNEKRIPARPFLRSTLFVHRQDIIKFMDKLKTSVIFGESKADNYLDNIGLYVQRLVQKRIKDSMSWAVPNSPATIKRKGSSLPLVDTGRMRSSITYRIARRSIIATAKAIGAL